MHRRRFLAASLATSAAALTSSSAIATQSDSADARHFYQLRRYHLTTGPQLALTENYFAALLPALTRLGLGPIGAFRIDIGPETPTYILFIPGASVETLATLDLRLAEDQEFLSAAAPFWNAPASAPPFNRIDVSLLAAFHGWPRITPPGPPAAPGKRIFQLRTYESPSHQDHIRKIEMFHSGEFDIFRAAGFRPVFFADTLVGTRMPSLTYMLAFDSLAQLDAQWNTFRADPAWQKLSHAPRFAYEPIVSNITNLVLSPLAVSHV
ncbi:MAG: NIPSNAP family protein [Acidobacteriaceae bacterium]